MFPSNSFQPFHELGRRSSHMSKLRIWILRGLRTLYVLQFWNKIWTQVCLIPNLVLIEVIVYFSSGFFFFLPFVLDRSSTWKSNTRSFPFPYQFFKRMSRISYEFVNTCILLFFLFFFWQILHNKMIAFYFFNHNFRKVWLWVGKAVAFATVGRFASWECLMTSGKMWLSSIFLGLKYCATIGFLIPTSPSAERWETLELEKASFLL